MIARSVRRAAGFSLVEMTLTAALIATVSAMAIPRLLAGLDDARASAATHYVMGRLHDARMMAITRSTHAGLGFVAVAGGYEFTVYIDQNRNGIRSADIARGIDVPLESGVRLAWQFSGADFGTLPSLPSIDGTSGEVGADPIKFGPSDIVSFAPDGSSSSGTLYVLGPRGSQYAVRVFGDTGRIRMLKFDPSARKWLTLQ